MHNGWGGGGWIVRISIGLGLVISLAHYSVFFQIVPRYPSASECFICNVTVLTLSKRTWSDLDDM